MARLLRTGFGAPAWNQSVDEALLRVHAEDTLRLYRWDPAGLSLGYFQKADDFRSIESDVPFEIVRRTTGGQAIFHDRGELTFSLLYRETRFAGKVAHSYERVHGALEAALSSIGIDVEFGRAGERARSDREASPWCFHHATPLCALLAGRKVIGSAQRRLEGWVLHHGSILLEASPLTPGTGALRDVRADLTFEELEDAVIARLAVEFEVTFAGGILREDEHALACALREDKYGSDAWTHRR